jgi:outer membrane protein TolC
MILDEKLIKRELYNANRDFLPDLELDVNYKKRSSQKDLSGIFDSFDEEWSVGINTNYGFNTTSQEVNRQRLVIQQSKILRDKYSLRRYIFKEINKLKNNYINILENLKILKLKQEESKNSLKVAKIRYERGLSSNLDILDAENAYSSSQIDYISEILKHNYALLVYAKALNELDIDYVNKVFR